ncbi:Ras GEF [Pleurostoma richardsiae]|uniref:Ras GEF n=1 Tax=Pleurostoma richardsiae TaxID=41990 RepID=A0AA38RXS5_9PEZI|nr:Ras GEF [Pleurostoma richardsiae]
MDAGVDSTALPIQGPRTRQRPPPATKGSSRSPVTPRDGGVGSARSRHTATVSTRSGGERRGAARGAKSKARLLPGTVAKSLLPATERRSHEDYPLRKPSAKKGSDERWEIAPDGGSAGREGRHFTVANVGNNGRIYLRPTVRPANQRYPQPHFVFPITPPGTAGLDGLATVKTTRGIEDLGQTNGTQWTPSQAPSTPIDQLQAPPNGIRLPTGHRRAVSDSTIRDASVARESEPGAFKIVITQPGEETRLRTVEDRIDPASSPLLEVAIPSWKIGTPRFTLQGTPFFRGSSYAPTEDFHSSHHSLLNPSRSRTPRTGSIMSRRPTPIEVPQEQLPAHADPNSLSALSSARLPLQNMLRSTYLSGHLVIEPTMFDALTFKPACDDRAIVRYSPATGAVTAATPPRLVAEITSPSFLDYELLSDFFLTFRAFLEPSDLLHMLIARLRWALARDDETGMVVRVRTFVALRHWILNYFVDDFVIDYQLRLTFCNLLNDFVEELSQDTRGGKVQLKILAELKKCWRRVCAQYWDGPEFDSSLELEAPIAPGGLAGHRSTSLDPRFWEKFEEGPLHLDAVLSQSRSQDEAATASCQNTSKVGRIDSVLMGHQRPGTPEEPGGAEERLERRQASSPTSITSLDVTSCSFPTRNLRLAHLGSSYPLAPHPVDPSSVYANAGPVATTPKALVGKRVRPHQSHKRNGSLTDSLREHPTTQDKSTFYKNAELILTLPYAGSLVRGNLLPPGQALVEVLSPNTPGAPSRQTTVFQPHPTDARKDKGLASGMSGPGMRRLLGSVRRALSTRGQGVSPTQGSSSRGWYAITGSY